jgi:hypothetical protein
MHVLVAGRRVRPFRGDTQLGGQADLREIVAALRTPGRFPGRLHGGQEQGHEDRQDRDYDEHLDQRKPAAARRLKRANETRSH